MTIEDMIRELAGVRRWGNSVSINTHNDVIDVKSVSLNSLGDLVIEPAETLFTENDVDDARSSGYDDGVAESGRGS